MKESFLIYKSFYEPIKMLTNEQLGRLFRSIFDYQIKNIETLTGNDSDIKMAFSFFKNQFILDEKKYQKRLLANRQNGLSGGRKPKKPNGFIGLKKNPNNPMGADNDNEKDNENENEKENEKETIVKIWNDFANRNSLSKILKLSPKRISCLNARTKEKDFDLNAIFKKIEKSNFLLGENKNCWKVDFEFVFCSANNYLKILEGKYDNQKKRKGNYNDPEFKEWFDNL